MVSAGYSGLKLSPGSGFFAGCPEPRTHEYSGSLGRLLGRAAVGAMSERSERMGSSTIEARCVTHISVKIKAFKQIKARTAFPDRYRPASYCLRKKFRIAAATASGACTTMMWPLSMSSISARRNMAA